MSGQRACEICGCTDNLKRCGFCKTAVYCSRDHQSKDWSNHKPTCLKLRETAKQNQNTEISVSSRHCASVTTHETTKVQQDHKGSFSDGSYEHINAITDRKSGEKYVDIEKSKDDVDVPFDVKPFKDNHFPTLNKNDPDTLAKFATEGLKSKGHCVVDATFAAHIIDDALTDIKRCETEDKFYQGKLAGGRTSGVEAEKTLRDSIRCDKIMWVEGNEDTIPGIRSVVKHMDAILNSFNEFLGGMYSIKQRTKAMVACYPGNGTFYRRHVDNPSKDGRVITCILYLNKGWNVLDDGGVLRIFPTSFADGDYVDVAPLANRLLFFWSDKRNPHEVQPAYKSRYAITVWYFDEAERREACKDHHHSEMATLRGQLTLMELESHKEETRRLSKRIEDQVSSVISSLSEEELKALAAVVVDHPDPRAVLTGLGVDRLIQDRLLDRLKHLI